MSQENDGVETCVVCKEAKPLVYSGIDALLMNCLEFLGEICYDCANLEAGTAYSE